MTAHLISALLAAPPPAPGAIPVDGGNVKGWLTTVAGNIFLALVVIQGAISVWRKRLLEVLGLAALAVLCAVFVYFPDVFQGLGQSVVSVVKGG
jgi:hypothetical protein